MLTFAIENTMLFSDLAAREPEENNRPQLTTLINKMPQKSSTADMYSEINNSRKEELVKTKDLQKHTINSQNLKKQVEELQKNLN